MLTVLLPHLFPDSPHLPTPSSPCILSFKKTDRKQNKTDEQ